MKKIIQLIIFIISIGFGNSVFGQAESIQAQHSVSPTGALTYNVPIEIPSYVLEHFPDLGLTYNSQSDGGIAGYGWSISGLTSISRIPATMHHDGFIDAVDFDNNDRYALDGQRLILKSGTYGAAGSTYVTENYSNLKIEAVGTSTLFGTGYGPSYFLVTEPNGTTYRYGNKSRLEWSISEVEDNQGNVVEYAYDYDIEDENYEGKTNRLLYVKDVSANVMVFFERSKNDKNVNTVGTGGHFFTNNRLIDRMIVTVDGFEQYRKYNLSHSETSYGVHILDNIKLTNALGNELPEIHFNYKSDSSSNDIDPSTFQAINLGSNTIGTNEFSSTITGDFNGDENLDFILYNKDRSDEDANQSLFYYRGSDNNSKSYVNLTNNDTEFDHVYPASFINNNNELETKKGLILINRVEGTNKLILDLKSINSNRLVLENRREITLSPSTYYSDLGDTLGDLNLKNDITTTSTQKDFAGSNIVAQNKISAYADVNYYANKSIILNPGFLATENCDFEAKIDSEIKDDNYTETFNWHYLAGDFNGDGSTDVLVVGITPREGNFGDPDRRYPTYLVDFNNNNKGNEVQEIGGFWSQSGQSHSFRITDFNGNGKMDIMTIQGDSFVEINEFNEETNQFDQITIHEIPNESNVYFPGDYNGDGKTDLAIPSEIGSDEWKFYISNGLEFKLYTKEIGIEYEQSKYVDKTYDNGEKYDSLESYFYVPLDYNKDGKTDFIKHKIISPISKDDREKGYSEQEIQYFTNESYGSGVSNYFNFDDEDLIRNNNNGDTYKGYPIFADYEGTNLISEYAYFKVDGDIDVYEYTGLHQEELTIKSIDNNGLTTSFQYEGLTENDASASIFGNTYSTYFSEDYEYPYVKISSVNDFKIVKEITQTFNGFTRTKEYKYDGLVSSTNGLGILGFNYVASSDWQATDVNAFWTVNKYDLKNRSGVIQSWTIKDIPTSATVPSSFVSKTDYEYTNILNSDKTYLNLPKIITQTNGLTGVTTTTISEFDEYYNPKKTIVSYPGGSKTTNIEYYNNPSGSSFNYYIGRPKKTSTTTILGSESFSTKESFTYEDNLIKTLTTQGNGSETLTETYIHDSFGNIIQTTISSSGNEADRVTKQSYDPETGRFLETKTDIENFTSTYEYYQDGTGYLKQVTDPFDRTTSYEYDGWGRLTLETDYLNNTIETSYTDFSSGRLAIRTNNSLTTSTSDTYKTINRLGWVTYDRIKDELNQSVRVDTEYDAIGRKKSESIPYISTSDRLYTTYFYDEYNRLIIQNLPNGKTVTTDYDGLTVSVDDETKTVSSTQDAVGNKISVTDPGGTITYEYYANNTPKTTTYGTNIIRNEIDEWGRKTLLNDPSAGIYTYDYTIFGDVLTEKTPKGVTTYTYDKYGKVDTKSIVGDNTDLYLKYKYDTNSQLGLIDAQDNINGKDYNYYYEYDDYLRPISVIEVTPEATFVKSSSYLTDGRINEEQVTTTSALISNTNNVKLKHNYSSTSGQLTSVSNATDNTVLWKAKAKNNYGEFTEIALGNGITKNNTFDKYGIPDIFTHESGTVTALDLDFNFDVERGNLKNRDNSFFDGEETFDYDDLDRLKNITGPVEHSKSYHNNGNINESSNVGTYEYDKAKAYRLAGVTLNDFGTTYYENHTPQEITYNAFKKPVSVYEAGNGRVDFEYGPMMNRAIAYYGGDAVKKEERTYKKIYSAIAPVEVIVSNTETKVITYTMGDAYTAPIAHVNDNGTDEFMYLHRDHLGSIMAITDEAGELVEQTHYGAWGTIQKYWDSAGNDSLGYASVLGRGYTGHEHFASVGLIHMNGRMYDATLGRFLSSDNYIQDPFNTQSFNRYGYVWNNPLKFNDPTGEVLITVLAIVGGAIVGGYLGGAVHNQSFNPGDWEWNFGTFAAITVGAAIGALAGGGIAKGSIDLLVSVGANSSQGFIPLGSVALTKGAVSIATVLTGTIAQIAIGGGKTKLEEEISENDLEKFEREQSNKPKWVAETGEQSMEFVVEADDVLIKEAGNLVSLTDSILSGQGIALAAYDQFSNSSTAKWLRNGQQVSKYTTTTIKYLGRALGAYSIYQNGSASIAAFREGNIYEGSIYLAKTGAYTLITFAKVTTPIGFVAGTAFTILDTTGYVDSFLGVGN